MKQSGNTPPFHIGRRGFIMTTLSAGFALATQPIIAQTVIHTDEAALDAGPIDVPASGGALPAYRAMPAGGKNLPTVLVVCEIFGVHEYIKDVCRRLAKAGYLAIAPEMYARHGDVAKMSDIRQIIDGPVAATPDAEHMADLDACAAWAAQHGGDPARLGITGFCRGGRTTWLYAAHNPKLKAAVAWYGQLKGAATANQPKWPIDLVAKLKAPVLGLYGGQDQGIPPEQVAAMREAVAAAGKKAEIHVYPDAPHAFHADYRPSYRKADAEDGWQRMMAWFGGNGV
ncbi:MAG: dienelactone hydrolase family protein [Zoogloeaceae bacterium]|jgi:carboxymethylenebutenolidase|nr:dienelactone hydrolase family protein [Zoogloeaceae bacterium]